MSLKESEEFEEITPESVPRELPVLPLRDVVIFPHMIFPVLVGRDPSIAAITKSIDSNKYIFLCAQRDANEEDLTPQSLYPEGTVAKILQVLKLPNGLMKVLVDGLFQAKSLHLEQMDAGDFTASIQLIQSPVKPDNKLRALVRQLDSLFAEYVKLHRNIPNETLIAYESISEDPSRKLFYVAANILVSVDVKQSILRVETTLKQFYALIEILSNEINILKIEMEIDTKVQENIQQSQRSFFIQEQIRILQRELGSEEDEISSEFADIHQRILDAKLPDEVMEKAMEEFDKLRRMSSMSPEATVTRNYLDWLVGMPWNTFSEDNLQVSHAQEVLDEDHYGLAKPKARILEHIAVLNLIKEMKGQILCFVGPPGVGKTSLGKSIARALGRQFVRIALGGIHDEAEIRGHRRTYIGSMPGKIIQALKRAGTSNPVVLLDEIDKMNANFQGDPASAMLEVLDPEQNHTFSDHYLDVDYDLSKTMFITTANIRYNIPLPLLDRMEIIELPGYLEHEKIEIARRHLVKKQIEMHGLKGYDVRFYKAAIEKILREYTMESGVRNLEREIATVCRKIAKTIVDDLSAKGKKKAAYKITPERIEELLGVPRIKQKRAAKTGKVGSITGLAWTSFGGDILHVDVAIMHGSEKLKLTGSLGDVMKESAHAALSYLRSHAIDLSIPEDFAEKREIHIHIPEGSIPKDGPSAGITMTMAIYSAVSGKSPKGDVAMTGEITLHGDVLAIGGLNEKLLAARRYGMKTILIPQENEKDLKDVSERITKGLKIVPVKTIDEAIPVVFG